MNLQAIRCCIEARKRKTVSVDRNRSVSLSMLTRRSLFACPDPPHEKRDCFRRPSDRGEGKEIKNVKRLRG